jgi:hypothetical protein
MDVWGSIPGRSKILLFSIVFRLALGPTQPSVIRVCVPMVFSPGVKRPELKVDHRLPFNAEVKNGGAIPPFPHMSSLH